MTLPSPAPPSLPEPEPQVDPASFICGLLRARYLRTEEGTVAVLVDRATWQQAELLASLGVLTEVTL